MHQPQPLIYAPLQFRMSNSGPNCNDTLISCPNCGAPSFIRDSERVTMLVKTIKAHCTNSACAATFDVELVAVRILSPGGCLRPDIGIPVAEPKDNPHILPPPRKGEAGKGEAGQASMFEPDTG